MTDCLATLHSVTQDVAASAKVRDGLYIAWTARFKAPERPPVKPEKPLRITGKTAKRHSCARAQKIIETTEKNWSEL